MGVRLKGPADSTKDSGDRGPDDCIGVADFLGVCDADSVLIQIHVTLPLVPCFSALLADLLLDGTLTPRTARDPSGRTLCLYRLREDGGAVQPRKAAASDPTATDGVALACFEANGAHGDASP